MYKRLIVGNWKMNPATLVEAKKICRKVRRVTNDLSHTQVVVCPSFVFLSACRSRKEVNNFFIGAQSVSVEEGGAHTGEVSISMLQDIGVEYVIVGHSEQRAKGDTDEIVSRKLLNVLNHGMTAIVCVGESNHDTEGQYLEILKSQIKNTFAEIPKKFAKSIIIAYEPIWAIGAKEAMRPEDICETAIFIKKVFADIFTPDLGVKTCVLYGGAVNFRNASEIITIGQVDGLLVGRESVNSAGFIELIKTVEALPIER